MQTTDLVFYNETSSNGKYQVMTKISLDGLKVKRLNNIPNGIHTHKGIIYKGLFDYSVDKQTLEYIKENYNTERTSF